MQILLPRCAKLLLHNVSFVQSRTSISSSFAANFRSTPTSFEKWKNKWNNSSDFGGPKPSKTYIKYKTRQKRADAKKALNDLLFRNGTSKFTLEGECLKKQGTHKWDEDPIDPINNRNKRDPSKASARRGTKPHQKRNKSKPKKDFFEDFDDDPGMHFQATFGNRWYSWSFKSWEESFSQSQTNGFEWREDSNETNNKRNKWRTPSDDESDDNEEPYFVGSNSDRVTLGLPVNGPLKIDEVKNAFRLSALKWHPDKHQGPSQALAEEKFKVCVSAYKSLCSAFSRD